MLKKGKAYIVRWSEILPCSSLQPEIVALLNARARGGLLWGYSDYSASVVYSDYSSALLLPGVMSMSLLSLFFREIGTPSSSLSLPLSFFGSSSSFHIHFPVSFFFRRRIFEIKRVFHAREFTSTG